MCVCSVKKEVKKKRVLRDRKEWGGAENYFFRQGTAWITLAYVQEPLSLACACVFCFDKKVVKN